MGQEFVSVCVAIINVSLFILKCLLQVHYAVLYFNKFKTTKFFQNTVRGLVRIFCLPNIFYRELYFKICFMLAQRISLNNTEVVTTAVAKEIRVENVNSSNTRRAQ